MHFSESFIKLPLVCIFIPSEPVSPSQPFQKKSFLTTGGCGEISSFTSIKPSWLPPRAAQAVTRVLPGRCCGMTQDETESDRGSHQTGTRKGSALWSHPCTCTSQPAYTATERAQRTALGGLSRKQARLCLWIFPSNSFLHVMYTVNSPTAYVNVREFPKCRARATTPTGNAWSHAHTLLFHQKSEVCAQRCLFHTH